MNSRAKTMILAFSLVSLMLSPLAEAARMGKGRSSGMRRSAPTQSYQRQAAPVAPPAQQSAPAQPQKKGIGLGTAAAIGAGAAAIGYMAGSANSNQANAAPAQASPTSAPVTAAPAPAPEAAASHIPWTLILALAFAFIVGLMWFRRRMATPEHAPQAMRPQVPNAPLPGDNRFDPIPAIGSGFPGSPQAMPDANASTLRRLPDGTETPYFLRQAKATFLHLQSLNSPDTLDEVRRYMTPELFEELRHEIAGNQAMADFTDLDCQLIDASEEDGRFVASVRFFGLVSEEVNSTPQAFSETWHFVKTPGGSKWMVAGIQQND